MAVPGPKDNGMGGGGNINNFRVMVDLPSRFTFEQTKEIVNKLEDFSDLKRYEYNIKATSVFARSSFFRYSVFLED